MFVTFLGLAPAPDLIFLWDLLGAVGCGSLIVIALSLFSLRTVNYPQAASLSGIAQSVGYGLAAMGPVMFGGLREASGSWTLPLLVTAGILAVLAMTGLLAGRDRVISGPDVTGWSFGEPLLAGALTIEVETMTTIGPHRVSKGLQGPGLPISLRRRGCGRRF